MLEYSTNHGSTWKDASPLFEAGQNYNATLSADFGNPLSGKQAFTGDSNGMVASRYNLASLAGQSVRFRWRVGSDNTISWTGWVIDDVRIYQCTIVSHTPSDFDGDGKSDPAKFDSSTNTLSYLELSTSTWQDVDMGAGTIAYVPRSDFDGDGKTDPAMFVPSANALWYLEFEQQYLAGGLHGTWQLHVCGGLGL